MIVFFEKTWFLWWAFAVIVILRWFSAASVDPPVGDPEPKDVPRDGRSGPSSMDQRFVPKTS
jgi:hypothetical protein